MAAPSARDTAVASTAGERGRWLVNRLLLGPPPNRAASGLLAAGGAALPPPRALTSGLLRCHLLGGLATGRCHRLGTASNIGATSSGLRHGLLSGATSNLVATSAGALVAWRLATGRLASSSRD